MPHPTSIASPASRRGAVWLLLLTTFSGCEVGRSFFQMSSDSPVPFFGVDLMPRRKTSLRMPERRSLEALPGQLVRETRTEERSRKE